MTDRSAILFVLHSLIEASSSFFCPRPLSLSDVVEVNVASDPVRLIRRRLGLRSSSKTPCFQDSAEIR